VRCAVCGENAGLIEDDDFKELKKLDARGLPFWRLHGRVIDRDHEDADRVSDVLDAYTPRAQAALSDILLKVEALSEEDRTALGPRCSPRSTPARRCTPPTRRVIPAASNRPRALSKRTSGSNSNDKSPLSLCPAISPARGND